MMTTETMQPFEQSFAVSPKPATVEVHATSGLDDEKYLLETFHQHPHGDFRPTFYNPFEIKHRRRTSRAQLKVLEKSFAENAKPNATVRRFLAQKLDMTPRGVQIWFQNRRAKAKLQRRKSNEQQQDQQQQQQQQQEFQQDSCDQDVALFSQFLTHVQPPLQTPMMTYLPSATSNKLAFSDITLAGFDVRSVAAAAAAQCFDPTLIMPPVDSSFSIDHHSWMTMPIHPAMDTNATTQTATRRKSCPVHLSEQTPIDCLGGISSTAWSDHYAMKERRLSEADLYHYGDNSHPGIERGWSFGALSTLPHTPLPVDYCHDMPLDFSHQNTSPLTESCSTSSIGGSPMTLESFYDQQSACCFPSSSPSVNLLS